MPNTTNNAIPSNLDAFPAQKVGGMRVKNPDARRTSLKDESKDASKTNEAEEEDREDEEYEEEQQRMRRRALEERQAQDMQNHAASRQPDISKNAGNNVQKQFITPTQPRSMNH